MTGVRIFLEKILAVDSTVCHIILNGCRGIMHKKVSMTLIMALAIGAILIVPWAALQRSYAQSDLANTILKIHNDERTTVGSPVLKWSNSLAADAKSWADHLASLPTKPTTDPGWNQCCGGAPDLVHGSTGENLWAGGANYFSTADMVQSWVSEKKNWNGGTFPGGCASWKVCGHYTHMVWRTTSDVGCATAIGNQGKFEFLVCRYSPPGNYNGQNPY